VISTLRRYKLSYSAWSEGSALAGDIEKCLEEGMDDFIVKPIKIGKPAEALKSCSQKPQSGDLPKEHGAAPTLPSKPLSWPGRWTLPSLLMWRYSKSSKRFIMAYSIKGFIMIYYCKVMD